MLDSVSNMAETEMIALDEPDCPLQPVELQTSARIPKVLDHRSLQKVLQKASHRIQDWPHEFSARTTPHNLFLEGFKDCASEVIRFLTEDEKVEDNNPLLVGLQSHLLNVSKTICQETFIDFARQNVESEKQTDQFSSEADVNNKDINSTTISAVMPCVISPTISKSANTSVSDSCVESDYSVSISSVSDINQHSVLHENSSSLNSFEKLEENSDDVFNNLTFYLQATVQPTERLNNCSSHNLIPPLRHLALAALQQLNINQTVLERTCTSSEISELASVSQHGWESFTFPLPNLPPLDQSSPLPGTSLQFTPSNIAVSLPQQCSVLQETGTGNISQSSADTFGQISPVLNITHDKSPQNHSLSPSQESQIFNQTTPFSQILPGNIAASVPVTYPLELPHQMSSILELKANFLPGINTSSVASGNFADILLAVEACRFHEDPRVRGLAEELIHLIHNDSAEDDEEEYDDEYFSDSHENMNDVVRENGDESGIEMMDESADWGNAADMIEQ